MDHGFSLYRHGCRCDICKAANTRRMKQYRLSGVKSISPELVRKHVNRLIRSGMSQPDIARQAAVSLSTINRIVYPHMGLQRVLKRTAARILAIQPRPTDTKTVDAEPARRRLKALACMGWRQEVIADQAGVSIALVNAVTAGRRNRITNNCDQRIRAVYERLSMVHGPHARSAKHALRQRWIPPLGWDDIDDLEERPRWRETVHSSLVRPNRSVR